MEVTRIDSFRVLPQIYLLEDGSLNFKQQHLVKKESRGKDQKIIEKYFDIYKDLYKEPFENNMEDLMASEKVSSISFERNFSKHLI